MRRDGEKPKPKRRPLPELLNREAWELDKVVRRVEAASGDERLKRHRDAAVIAATRMRALVARLDVALERLDVKPTATETAIPWSEVADLAQVIAMADVDEETFEAILAEARTEGDLSQRNVLAKVKAAKSHP